jgi:cytochrome c peroxidase
MKRAKMVRGLGLLIGVAALGCSDDRAPPPSGLPVVVQSAPSAAALQEEAPVINPRLLRRFQTVKGPIDSSSNPATPAKVALGRRLFYDARLSATGDVSCNSCHDLASYGVDHRPTSVGARNSKGTRNAPTVYNAAGHFAQFWDGRAHDVEEQAKGPILHPGEMAMANAKDVVAVVKRTAHYPQMFREAFPGDADPLTFDNVAAAIAAFERGLVTPGRWDRFLDGDAEALTTPEKQGLKTFLNVGCMVCHTGPYLGGSMFERVGVVEPWPNQEDTGRMAVTRAAQDRMMFKVPSLRNVEKTAPYFHDGSAETLEIAVHKMGKHQLGLDLSETEVGSIVTWLKCLTGELPKDYIAAPTAQPASAQDGK